VVRGEGYGGDGVWVIRDDRGEGDGDDGRCWGLFVCV